MRGNLVDTTFHGPADLTMRDSTNPGLNDQPPAPPRILEQIPLQELYRQVPEDVPPPVTPPQAPVRQPVEVDDEDMQPPDQPQQSMQPLMTLPIRGLIVPLPDSPMQDSITWLSGTTSGPLCFELFWPCYPKTALKGTPLEICMGAHACALRHRNSSMSKPFFPAQTRKLFLTGWCGVWVLFGEVPKKGAAIQKWFLSRVPLQQQRPASTSPSSGERTQ